MNEKYGKWQKIGDVLGIGGQGDVYLAIEDSSKEVQKLLSQMALNLYSVQMAAGNIHSSLTDKYNNLYDNFKSLNGYINPTNKYVIKIYKSNYKSSQKAKERFDKEIKSYELIDHKNVFKIVDHNKDEGWWVSKYYKKRHLGNNLAAYKGNLRHSLNIFRQIVEGVQAIHNQGIVHRDLKPENIFIDDDEKPIIADMGIVFFMDDTKTRITDTMENVGSWQWMPQWAMGKRIEDIDKSIDIYGLGKILWSMLSGRSYLNLWYYDKDDYNIERMFPNLPEIQWAKKIFEKCIVEEKNKCLESTEELLKLLDTIIQAVNLNADVLDNKAQKICHVCGLGKYEMVSNGDAAPTHNFGLRPAGIAKIAVSACSKCGHVHLFYSNGY